MIDPESFTAPDGPRADPATADRRPVILLVDDEQDILTSIQLLLERSPRHPRVITAASGPEGLEALRSQRVDLVISDFKMPGMDGIQFLMKAHQVDPDLPSVMFTAYADAELARRAVVEAFVREFIPKTLAPRELVQRIEAVLDATPSR